MTFYVNFAAAAKKVLTCLVVGTGGLLDRKNELIFKALSWLDIRFFSGLEIEWNGILLSKLFWPTVRKKCYSDREKLLKFEAEGREFAKFLRSLEQFIHTVKGQNNFW